MTQVMTHKLFTVLFTIACLTQQAQSGQTEFTLNANSQGFIPAWLVSGPYEFPLVGFGTPKDTVAIGEPDISPIENEFSSSILPEKDSKQWFPQSIDKEGFIDFNNTLLNAVSTNIPVKIWYSRAGYAFTTIQSEFEKDVLLTIGSNSQTKIFLNKNKIYESNNSRNAAVDQDTILIKLKKGTNDLIVRVLNTHTNLGMAYFGTVKWEWGFFARLLNINGSPVNDVKYIIPLDKNASDFSISSTLFFKGEEGDLKQRIDVEINSKTPSITNGSLKLLYSDVQYNFKLDSISFGKTRHSIFIPEILQDEKIDAELILGEEKINNSFLLKKQKKYTLHLMLLNHTDVGYTHPQPVCEELHCNTLDEVIKMCEQHPDFCWTIETTWQLEAYEKLRSKEKFEKLISYIKNGRVALSPIYTNPFTGWISEEEMLRSFDKAIDYRNRYGISFSSAVYNDVPGQSWFLPQALENAGVKFVAEGINEFYSDYILQRSLPKIFKWESADGSKVVTYLNEAYNEGRSYGLESNSLLCVEQRILERIKKLEARNYPSDLVLVNTSFSDNSILASQQYLFAMKWNEQYEYPKFISSNVEKFSKALIESDAYFKLPVLRGDWTSNWDIFYQGEFERNKLERWNQHQLLSAEKLSTISHLLDNSKLPLNFELNQAYRYMHQFSGHGSGLELGYGSPEENKLTMDYRQSYVTDAKLLTDAILLKSLHRISVPEESFESEGLMVFNTLSWRRDDIVEIQFPFPYSPEYNIVDAVTNKIVPSFRKDHRQYFIATEIPSLGYKKYLFKPKSGINENPTALNKTNNAIENQYYKILYDINSQSIKSIIEKESGKELLDNKSFMPFCSPTIEKFQLNENHKAIPNNRVSYEIIDESPVRLILRQKRDGEVLESIDWTLLNGVKKVFVSATANLKKMEPTTILEEYGLPFSFNIKNSKAKLEILGGYIEQAKDRFPGISHDGASLRRSVSIYNETESVTWTTADARVIRIRKDEVTGNHVIISNPVINFPENWNRHENLSNKIEFRYSFTYNKKGFEAGAVAREGYELNTPLQLRKSWYRALPVQEEFITIENPNIILLNIKATDKGFILRFINSDNDNNQTAIINSKFLTSDYAQKINLLGMPTEKNKITDKTFQFTLKASEVADFLININK
ncbi:MAG: hypothetical protein HXY50_07435 [Ignavibacteriaceae bacterium]|nr:hypothetical protein [Ignavibacteriaceae bacterium]